MNTLLRKNKNGFTLLEIIIAVAIVGIFIALPTIVFTNQFKKSRDNQRKNDLHNIEVAVQAYKFRHGVYPDAENWETTLVSEGLIQTLPVDPKNNQPVPNETGMNYQYTYESINNGSGYRLIARLEYEGLENAPADSASYYILTERGSSYELTTQGSGLPPAGSPLAANTPIPSLSPYVSPTIPTKTPTPTPTGASMVISNIGNSGFGGSLALGSDGFPIMTYFSDGTLMFAKCPDVRCTTSGIVQQELTSAVSGTPSLTTYTSIMAAGDGYPMIAYISQQSGRTVQVYDCNNMTCSSGSVRNIDTDSNSGYYPDIVLMNDGNPLITYWHSGNNDLAIVKCSLANCSTGGTRVFANGANGNSFYPSVIIRTNGLPLVAYNSDTDQDIFSVRCTSSTCSQASIDTPSAVTNTNTAISFVSAAKGVNGYPIMSYYNEEDKDLMFVRCNDANCSSIATPVVVDAAGDVGAFSSITADANGFAVITYMQVNSGSTSNPVAAALKVAKCTDASCSSPIISTIESGNVGMFSNVVVPNDGKPFITYYDQGNDWLKGYKCGNANCR